VFYLKIIRNQTSSIKVFSYRQTLQLSLIAFLSAISITLIDILSSDYLFIIIQKQTFCNAEYKHVSYTCLFSFGHVFDNRNAIVLSNVISAFAFSIRGSRQPSL